jgi:hypothetical protein
MNLRTGLNRARAEYGRWEGVAGTRRETRRLKRHGFLMTTDCRGNVYYVMPEGGHIIHLYQGGTWDSDKARADWSLKEYFAWLAPRRAELVQALAAAGLLVRRAA